MIKLAHGFAFRIVEPAIVLSQCDPGLDWSARRVLLAKFGRANSRAEVRLFWRLPHTGWISRGETGYYPGELVVQWRDPHRSHLVWAHRYCDDSNTRKPRTRLGALLKDKDVLNAIHRHFAGRIPGMVDGAGDDAFRVFWPLLGPKHTVVIGASL